MIDRDDQLVTVFGGGGFIGRYVCEYLLRAGVRIRVAQRNPRCAHFLQPLGQVGQIGYVAADVADRSSTERALAGANGAINLVGILKGAFAAVHVDGARNVAEAAASAGCQALVHVSALGADSGAEARYARSKGEGEAAARAAFASATIIRPSLVFGPEDDLTNRFAAMARLPLLPVIAPNTRFQPVFVRDLAKAIAAAALDPGAHGGRTYEIGGPDVMTMRDLVTASARIAGFDTEIAEIPDPLAAALATLGFMPGAPLTRDQWLMLQSDNLPSGDLPGLEAFGVSATPLGSVAYSWLGRFSGNRFLKRRVNLTAS